MVQIRSAYTSDLHEIVAMYKDLVKIVFPNRKIGSDFHFYNVVISWINAGHNIVISENNGKISGFYLSYVDDMQGLTEPVYYVAELYIKPQYRKTKAFYLMFENIKASAKAKKMKLVCDAVEGITPIYEKFAKPLLTRYERGF